MRSTLATLLILTIAASACGDDDASNADVHVCPHRAELLFARTLDKELRPGKEFSTLTRITEQTPLVENMTPDDLAALAAQGIGLYQVAPTDDPLDVAVELSKADPPVAAAPVLLVAPAGHWTFGPGDDFHDEPGDLQQTVPGLQNDAPVVGVVDTGYTETENTVHWLADHVEAADQSLDKEGATEGYDEGHGMFVASVIVRSTPTARVIVAGMANVPPEKFQGVTAGGYDPGLDESLLQGAEVQFGRKYTSDELQLYFGVRRLLGKQSGGAFTFAALNLSVGSHQCNALSQEGMGIWAALDLWYDGTGEAPVVAAAGNDGPINPSNPGNPDFIPGQMGDDQPVGIPGLQAATTPSAPPTVAVETHPLFGVESLQADMTSRSTFTNLGAVSAMGEDLCGVRIDGNHTTWSGSSFATAVVTAAIAADRNTDLTVPIGTPVALRSGCTISTD